MIDYVPCTTPLNMTITLNGFPEMPLHPLDLTTQSQSDASSSNCVGLIQTDGGIMDTSPSVSDMILGVAFLRNVYTVMAYDVPDAHGVFPASKDTANLQPRVGLLSLTNSTRAMQEFHNVRVLNLPLSSGNSSSPTSATSSRKLSIGVDVLLALLSIIVACVALFGLRWFYVRRRLRKGLPADLKPTGAMTTYSLAPNASTSSVDLAPGMSPGMSIAGSSARTVVGQGGAAVDEFGLTKHKDNDGERGGDRVVSYLNLDPGDPSGWRDTLVGSTVDYPKFSSEPASSFEAIMMSSDEPPSSTRDAALAAAAVAGLPMHRHNASDIGTVPEGTGVVEPLLSFTAQHARVESAASFGAISARSFRPNGYSVDDDLAEFGAGRESMAGVGTAARSSRIRARHDGDSSGSIGNISLVSVSGPGPGHGPRPSFDGRFPSIAPGERLSFSSITEQATSNATPQNPS
jgi:hypothetical protein